MQAGINRREETNGNSLSEANLHAQKGGVVDVPRGAIGDAATQVGDARGAASLAQQARQSGVAGAA